MKDKNNISREIEKTLSSIDGVQRAKANPFLYTRITARLEGEVQNPWSKTIGFITRPAFAIAIIVLVLSVNAFTLYSGTGKVQQQELQASNASSDLSDEYGLAVNTFYDYETP